MKKKLALWLGGICVSVLVWAVAFGGMSWLGGDSEASIFNPTVRRYIVAPGLAIGALVGLVTLVLSAREFLREMKDTPCEHCGKRGEHRH